MTFLNGCATQTAKVNWSSPTGKEETPGDGKVRCDVGVEL